MRNTPDIMHKTSVLFKALMALFFIGFFCIPVSAYSSDATNLFNAGRELTESGNYTEAMAAFHDAIALEPLYYEAWDSLADALNRNGQFNDALAASNRSLTLHPEYVQGWINRGQILYNIGYWYEDTVRNIPAADALYAEQVTAFEKAITLDPTSAEAWFNKGYALAGMKRYDEAIAAFDQVKVIVPSYPNLEKNREIAVQLRNKTASAPPTTGSIQSTPAETTPPETIGQQPAGTSPQPSPLNGIVGVIAILGAGFLILQRK
jgi:tetratricopeptide (TPR) repeat protein